VLQFMFLIIFLMAMCSTCVKHLEVIISRQHRIGCAEYKNCNRLAWVKRYKCGLATHSCHRKQTPDCNIPTPVDDQIALCTRMLSAAAFYCGATGTKLTRHIAIDVVPPKLDKMPPLI
jgi:hypothetical protein